MLLSTWFLFLGLATLATASPGPNAILALSNGVYYGRYKALLTVAGSVCGLSLLVLATASGLYAMLAHVPIVFSLLKWCGVVYLFVLGVQQYRNQKNTLPTLVENKENRHQTVINTSWGLFLQGFWVAISNPKVLLFLSVFFTPFISPNASWALQISILAMTFLLCECLWQSVYALTGDKLSAYMSSEQHFSLFNKVTGLFFIGSAIFIAWVIVS